jgi:hypothetical protein
MGRRSYSGEKWRKEQARKAKRDAKAADKKKDERASGESGGGPPIDWDSMVGGPGAPGGAPPAEPEEEEKEKEGDPPR